MVFGLRVLGFRGLGYRDLCEKWEMSLSKCLQVKISGPTLFLFRSHCDPEGLKS